MDPAEFDPDDADMPTPPDVVRDLGFDPDDVDEEGNEQS